MPGIRIVIEAGPGKRVEFERETEDLVDGHGNPINPGGLRQMWQEMSGEVWNWLRYREPADPGEAGMEKPKVDGA